MNNPRGRWMAAGLLAALCIGCLGALFGGTREAGSPLLMGGRSCSADRVGWTVPEPSGPAGAALLHGAGRADGRRAGAGAAAGAVRVHRRDGAAAVRGRGRGRGPAAGCALAAAWRGLCALPLGPKERRRSTRQVAWGCAALIFVCWLPVMLAYWPGISAYDIYTQIFEVFEDDYTNRNPLLHTLILGAFYRLGEGLGSAVLGYALFILMQMAVMAGAYGAAMGLSVAHRRAQGGFLDGTGPVCAVSGACHARNQRHQGRLFCGAAGAGCHSLPPSVGGPLAHAQARGLSRGLRRWAR